MLLVMLVFYLVRDYSTGGKGKSDSAKVKVEPGIEWSGIRDIILKSNKNFKTV